MTALTPRQQAIYDFICLNISQKGYPPTLRDICGHMGIASSNGASVHLASLARKGWIILHPYQARGIQLTQPLAPVGFDLDRDFERPLAALMRAIEVSGADDPGSLREQLQRFREDFLRLAEVR